MHKLEVLKRAPGAAPGGPRVVTSAGMTLSFKLPPSYARRLAAPASAAAVSSSDAAGKGGCEEAAVAAADKDEGEDVPSWEDRDWEAQTHRAVTPSADTGASVSGAEQGEQEAQWEKEEEEEEEDLATRTETKTETETAVLDEWEQSETPELPDDFPRLIVNLTRLQRQHFPPAPGMEHEQVDTAELVATVKTALHRHFTHMAEALFEQQSCFHCTYGSARAMLDGLHAAYPADVFALIDYPAEIDGIALHEYMVVLSRASPWKSVEYLKDCLRRCSRDLKWKMDVALELELLAEREHARFTAERQKLSDEIDDLSRLRDSFQAKLDKLKLQGDGALAHGSSVMLLRKLEDIENRLLTLVDEFLAEPELLERECDGMFGAGDGQRPTAGMNVLDMVVAMIFGRLPRDFSTRAGSEEHFEMLLDHHIHVRRLWKKDFGRLPPRSHARGDSSDAGDDEHEQPMAQEPRSRGDAEYDEAAFSEQEEGEGEEEEEETVALALALEASASLGAARDSSSSSKLDEWEAVETDDGAPARAVDGLDGYGADFDSDESDADGGSEADEFVAVSPPAPSARSVPSPASEKRASHAPDAVTPSSDALVRRHRHRALPGEASSQQKSAKKSERRKKKGAKDSKRASSRRTSARAAAAEQPFQPFACTRAVGLLQIAKDKEMF